jgi:hypothetical protein
VNRFVTLAVLAGFAGVAAAVPVFLSGNPDGGTDAGDRATAVGGTFMGVRAVGPTTAEVPGTTRFAGLQLRAAYIVHDIGNTARPGNVGRSVTLINASAAGGVGLALTSVAAAAPVSAALNPTLLAVTP